MVMFFPLGVVWPNFGMRDYCSVLILHTGRTLRQVFDWENEGLWTHVLHRSCSCIRELDVRLLNHLNWTSTTQVMVHFLGLQQLRLFLSLCPDFRIGFRC